MNKKYESFISEKRTHPASFGNKYSQRQYLIQTLGFMVTNTSYPIIDLQTS